MRTIPISIEPIDHTTNNPSIPKVIYQTWKSNQLTDYLYRCAYTWISKNPDYAYEFYDDERMESFVHNFDCTDFSFDKEQLIKAFNSFAHPVGKCDIWRYLIMYSHGGVYMDIDTKCAFPLRDYVEHNDTYVTGIDLPRGVHQWGIIISPKHPFMKETIENAIKCVLTRKRIPGTENKTDNLEIYTGPYVMNYSIKSLLKIKPEKHFGAGNFHIKLKSKKYKIKILPNGHMNGYVIFEYDKYRQDLRDNNIQYWQEDKIWK